MSGPPGRISRRRELRELWVLAVPIIVAQTSQGLMMFVDTAVLARAGTASLSAVALSSAMFFVLGSFGGGMIIGIDPLVSQSMGAGNERRARVLLWQGSYLAIIAGCLLAIPALVVPRVLPHFGVQFEELPLVEDYMTWRAPGLPLMLLYGTVRAYVQSIERPGVLIVSSLIANVFNLASDVLLVFGGADLPAYFGPLRAVPALGVKGAALTTTLCCLLQWGIVAWYVRTRVPVPGGMPWVRPVWSDIRKAMWVGMPVGVQIVADEGIHALMAFMARGLGPESVSAHQMVLSYGLLSFTVAAALGIAGSVRVGMAVGARDTPLARLRGQLAIASGAIFMGSCGIVFLLFPLPLARLIGAPSEVLPLLVPLLMMAAVWQLPDSVLAVTVGVMRGMGETRFPSIAIIGGHYLVGLPVAAVLAYGLGYGVLGLMGGLCAGFMAMAAALLWRFERLSSGTIQPLES
jgi:multidrug resistance protein, MATE family